MGKIIYLAHPYSDKDPAVMSERFDNANKIAGTLMKGGYIVFSPLSHSVPIADHIGNHLSHDFWLKQDLAWLAFCDELWVCLVPGWDNSTGVRLEIEEAHRIGRPVIFFDPRPIAEIKRCVHQVSRPDTSKNPPPGWGDCKNCTTDDQNGRCAGYCPVEVKDVEVKP